MTTLSLGSYVPELMVITIKHPLNALSNPDNPVGFKDAGEVGVFFHEWIHYLHNTSTLLGLTTFNSIIGLWHIFRSTYDKHGLSGIQTPSDIEVKGLNEILCFMGEIRKSSALSLSGYFKGKNIDSIKVNDVELQHKIIGDNQSIGVLKCKIGIVGNDNYTNHIDVNIKTHEIIENVAWLLEKKLILNIDKNYTLNQVEIIPYRIVELLANFKAPNLNEDEVICCMLSALQACDPPSALLEAFKLAEFSLKNNMSVRSILTEFVREQFQGNINFINEVFDKIQVGFSVNEPIGLGIKSVAERIKNNLNFRQESPFFELDIINQVEKNLDVLNASIKKYGGCVLMQEREGRLDDIQRDIIYEFLHTSHKVDWQIFHAAFKFLSLHISGNKFIPINVIPSTKKKQCPFYTSCNLDLRINDPSICKEKPWESECWSGWGDSNPCWYGVAVKQTRPETT